MKSKILIVEDEAIEAMNFEQILKSSGYDVVAIASAGEDALLKASDLKPDLILMDIVLKGHMDGIEAASRIRDDFDIPVIYLSAHLEENAVRRAKITSPYGYLIKPVTKTDLRNNIELALYKHEMETKLKKSEDKYRSIMENVLDAYFRGDTEGRITMASPSAAEMYRFDAPEEMIGISAFSMYKNHEDRYKMLKQLESEGKVENMEVEGLRKDDTTFWVSMNAQYVYDRDGKIQGTEAFIRNINPSKMAEKEQWDGINYYKTIFQHTGTATVILNEDTTISQANDEFVRLSGYSHEQLEGKKSWTDFIAPDELDRMKGYHDLRRKDPGAAPSIYYFKFMDKQGEVKNIQLDVDIIPGTKKSVASLLDVTELKRSQEALMKSEKKYRELVDTSLVGVYITRLNGDILFANQAMNGIWNVDSLEDLKNKNITEFYSHPADRDQLIELLKGESNVNQFETEFLSADGKTLNVLISAHLSNDTISGMVIDITDRKKADKALKASENKYHGLFNHAADGIFLVKGDRFVDCNEKTLEVYGVTRDQIIGQTPYAFSPELQDDGEPSKDKSIKLIDKALAGVPQHFQWQHLRYDGTPFYAEVSLNRVKIEDEYLIQAIVRDITERKKAEELEKENIKLQELDKLKSMFIASMSHELRTPLNSIIGFTGIMLQGMTGELTEEQQKQLTIIKNSSSHLLALINDVIDISKIEADKVELFIENFDLAPVLVEIEESFRDSAERKGLKMSLIMPGNLPVYGDERRVKQVIMNLVSNSVKFTDQGEIIMQVTEKEGTVEVSVKDTGMGIKEEEQNKLFKAFSRIQTEDQPIVEGTGLGLYLSQKIAGLLGGNITVNSEFNKGSEFTFSFPVKYSKKEVIS